MRKLYYFLFIVLFTSSCSQIEHNDLTAYGMLGDVKQITVTIYATGEPNDIKSRRLTGRLRTAYDKYGNETEYVTYNRTGSVIDRIVSSIDKRLNKASSRRYYSGADFTDRVSSKFNEKNKISEELWYNKYGKNYRKDVRSYDDQGIHNGSTEYYSDGSIAYLNKTSYDENGRETQKTKTLPNGKTIEKTTTKRDQEGRIKYLRYEIKGKEILTNELKAVKFDDKGNWTERIVFVNGNATEYLVRELEYY